MKNVRSSQPFISMNFCTEFSKAGVFPGSTVNAGKRYEKPWFEKNSKQVIF